jgi:putative oxidoreductase
MNEKCCDTRCPISTSLGLLVLRLVAGLFLATHGWAKFHDPSMKKMFFEGVAKMDLPAPNIFAWAAIAAELVGGVLLALGFLTRFWAFMILCVMGMAVFKVHWKEGYKAMEHAALYGGIAAAFLLGGPGRISVDGILFGRGKKNSEEPPLEDSTEKF